MAREKSLWQWLLRGLKAERLAGRPAHWERVENACSSGMPDTYLRLGPHAWWVELKEGWRLKTGNVRVKFRPQQRPWMLKERWAGGNVAVLIRVGGERFLVMLSDAWDLLTSSEGYPPHMMQKIESASQLIQTMRGGPGA